MAISSHFIGIDQGYSRTRIAVASRAGCLIHVDEERTLFDRHGLVPAPTAARLQVRYRRRLSNLLERLPVPSGTEVSVYLATNGGLLNERVAGELTKKGLRVLALEAFSDVHAHYGLTGMPGECAVYPCGSYYNLRYYDRDNRFTGLSGAYCDAISWGSGLCAYYLGNMMLDVYARSCLEDAHHALVQAVEERLGPRTGSSIYDYVKRVRTTCDQGCVMQLAPLVSRFRGIPFVWDYLVGEIKRSILALRILEEHARGDLRRVFLGGSVFVNNAFLVDLFHQALADVSVEVARGHTGLGAILFGLQSTGGAGCDVTLEDLPRSLRESPMRR
jgi:hypothetical protein